MKKYIPVILIIVMVLFVGCTFKNNDTQSFPDGKRMTSSNANDSQNIPDDARVTSSPTDVAKVYAASKEGNEVYGFDFETAYAMCVQAIIDFQYARIYKADADFSKYVKNPDLLDYMYQAVKAPVYAYPFVTKGDVKKTGLIDYELQKNERMYFKIIFGSNEDGNSSPCEFIVKNLDGQLIIAEWFLGGKDTFDSRVRVLTDIKNSEIYWEKFDKNALQESINSLLATFENM